MYDASDEKTQPWFYDIRDFAQKFRVKLIKGGSHHCPTCGRHNRVYRRTLNSAMARQLIILFQQGRGAGAYPWVHASEVVLPGTSGPGDFSKLKHWQLIEAAGDGIRAEDSKKSSGYWRITPAGVKFAIGQLSLQPVAVLLNDQLLTFEGDKAQIHAALGKKFNYSKLMGDADGHN